MEKTNKKENHCKFCNMDKTNIANTSLEETKNFFITPSLGSLVDGYILIISKNHHYNMAEFNKEETEEYIKIIHKYREIFFQTYGKYPIVFEHGSTKNLNEKSSSSIVHAHTHIVNHNYKDEENIIKELNFKKIENLYQIDNNKNYILYISPQNKIYLTYDFEPISQQMRILIANDLNITNKYDWRKDEFIANVESTIEKIKNKKEKQ